MGWDDGYTEGRLRVPDGRTVAWTEWGDPAGRVLLRVPGTPGSRWSVRADTSPWAERGLRVLTTERPGFGASTRLPGRGFAEHADDLARILDHLDVASVLLIGGSGGAPHELALCARHPDRVRAATVVNGAAPVTPGEAETTIPVNRESHRLVADGDRAGLVELLRPVRQALMADPLATFTGMMATAPATDVATIRDPGWSAAFVRSVTEALGGGPDGWVDEVVALLSGWDVDPARVSTSVTWYHAVDDRNVPVAAARRLVARLPAGRLVEWRDAGHLTGYHRERELLDELIARG